MLLKSYAKINLYLKISKKLNKGYHNIQSVMQQVSLHDNVSFESLNEDKIIVESNNQDLEGKNNLAYKAALLLKEEFKIDKGIRIFIEKNIPMSAGLGGGSSNAANTLVTLNKTWGLNLSDKKLIEFALQIGSDVPFFVVGKSALVEGIGEKVKPLKKSPSINIILVNPGIKVSTAWAYKEFDKYKSKEKNEKSVKELIKAIYKKDMKKISENMHNDFEPIIERKHKIINEIKTHLKKFDALNSLVSGSGPTVLGLFDSIYVAREAYYKLRDKYPFVYLTKSF